MDIYHINCHGKVKQLSDDGYFCANCGSYVLTSSLYVKFNDLEK